MLFIVNTNSVLNSPSFPWGCHVKQWLFKSKLVIVTGHDIVMEKKEQESFTSRSLELCAWQESFSLGTSFDLDTLKRSTKTNSGYNDSRLCHNIDTCKVSTPAKTGFGYSHIWLDMVWIYIFYHSICALFVAILKRSTITGFRYSYFWLITMWILLF